MFELCEATGNRPIVVGGMHILQRHGILDKLGVKAATMANYLDALERGYVGSNPFHNNVHAADVMFTLNYFLGRPLFREMVGPLDKFGALLAALAHDFAHPGVSNAFLMTTRSEEAVLYNDQSVLEMYHAAGSWRIILANAEANITEGFTPEMYDGARLGHRPRRAAPHLTPPFPLQVRGGALALRRADLHRRRRRAPPRRRLVHLHPLPALLREDGGVVHVHTAGDCDDPRHRPPLRKVGHRVWRAVGAGELLPAHHTRGAPTPHPAAPTHTHTHTPLTTHAFTPRRRTSWRWGRT